MATRFYIFLLIHGNCALALQDGAIENVKTKDGDIVVLYKVSKPNPTTKILFRQANEDSNECNKRHCRPLQGQPTNTNSNNIL